MKNKIIDMLVIISCILVLIEVFINKYLVFSTISFSLNIWVNSIIPSLFPFFVLSDILISYDVTSYIPSVVKRIFAKLFNVSDDVIVIFFLSIISGFPSSARNIRMMYDNKKIDDKLASHSLIFTHFSNPLFILGTVSVFFLHDNFLGIIILLSHYIPNFILGIITRGNCINNSNYYISKKSINNSFSKVMIGSLKNSIDSLFTILGSLTCFLVLSSIIINRFNLDIYTSSLLKGLFEVTMGIKSIASLNISKVYIAVLSSMFLSFGGLSVHMQVLSFLVDTNISYSKFLIARIYHSIISGIICYMLYIILF